MVLKKITSMIGENTGMPLGVKKVSLYVFVFVMTFTSYCQAELSVVDGLSLWLDATDASTPSVCGDHNIVT